MKFRRNGNLVYSPNAATDAATEQRNDCPICLESCSPHQSFQLECCNRSSILTPYADNNPMATDQKRQPERALGGTPVEVATLSPWLVSAAQTLVPCDAWAQEASTIRLLAKHRSAAGVYALRSHTNYGLTTHDIFKVGRADHLSPRFHAYREAQTIVFFAPCVFPRAAELLALRVLMNRRVHAYETVQCDEALLGRILCESVAQTLEYAKYHGYDLAATPDVEVDRQLRGELNSWLETTPLHYVKRKTRPRKRRRSTAEIWWCFLDVLGFNDNLPVVTRHLEDGTAVPQPFIDQIVAEKQAAKEGKLDPFVPHSVESKRRAALLACAAELGKVRCNHKDTLALIRTSLKHFNMSLDKPKYERIRKRDADGNVRQCAAVIKSILIRTATAPPSQTLT